MRPLSKIQLRYRFKHVSDGPVITPIEHDFFNSIIGGALDGA